MRACVATFRAYRAYQVTCFFILAVASVEGYAANRFDQGLNAYRNSDYLKALKILQPLATRGDPKAQYLLGVMRQKGQGVKQDFARAAVWYGKSAKQNHVPAQYNLGMFYLEGKGVKKNRAQAEKLLQSAAEKEFVESYYPLGMSLLNNPERTAEAKAWIEKAAEKGVVEAQFQLGSMYESGKGVEQNAQTAAFWYDKAAKGGNSSAKIKLTAAPPEQTQTPPQDPIEELNWYRVNAKQGKAQAQYQLGMIYAQGFTLNPNEAEAEKWLTLAAQQGNADAQMQLGQFNLLGKGRFKKNIPEAARWFKAAALQNNAMAQYHYGHLVRSGKVTDSDPEAAYKWLAQASEAGVIAAKHDLALIYEEGSARQKPDSGKAFQYYQQAAKAGYIPSMERLIEIYRRGELNQVPDEYEFYSWEKKVQTAAREQSAELK